MWTKPIRLEVFILVLLSLIPWPGPTVLRISCPRDRSSLVRRLVQKKWLPVLEKYRVRLPLECPFHSSRDIYGPQEEAKQHHRPSQWTCGFCGKSFYEERFLDMHFDNKHKEKINLAEDAVCLADYCDIMRCDVLLAREGASTPAEKVTTDVELWREASAHRTELSKAAPRAMVKVENMRELVYDVARNEWTKTRSGSQTAKDSKKAGELLRYQCLKGAESAGGVNTAGAKAAGGNGASGKPAGGKSAGGSGAGGSSAGGNSDGESSAGGKDNGTGRVCDILVEAALLAGRSDRLNELQRLKANCDGEELSKLKTKCEVLVRDCIAGLLLSLSLQDFKDIEEELGRGVCWYLTCDRYWEDTLGEPRRFPWGFLLAFITILTLGICFCYYIIWIFFDHDEPTTSASPGSVKSSRPAPAGTSLVNSTVYHDPSRLRDENSALYREEYVDAPMYTDDTQNEHYIYVTYPPELRQRLLESCYNRTTRI